MNQGKKNIGIFDSGIGGLSVVKEIMKILPNYSITYFGDTARVPYGGRSNELIIQYAKEDVEFLISKGAGLIIIACNSASALAYSTLISYYDLPIISVVEPGVNRALEPSSSSHIGIIGTLATINSQAHQKLLLKTGPSLKISTKACPLLVPIAENNSISQNIIDQIIHEYISPLVSGGVNTLILGCTHYPFFASDINRLFPKLNLIDPGREAALDLKNLLDKNSNLKNSLDISKNHHFFVSDKPQNFATVCHKFLGSVPSNIQKITLDN